MHEISSLKAELVEVRRQGITCRYELGKQRAVGSSLTRELDGE